MYGSTDLESIKLPDCPENLMNPQQIKVTLDLLHAADRGVILQVRNGSIFATRKCRCVFRTSTLFTTVINIFTHAMKLKKKLDLPSKRDKILTHVKEKESFLKLKINIIKLTNFFLLLFQMSDLCLITISQQRWGHKIGPWRRNEHLRYWGIF